MSISVFSSRRLNLYLHVTACDRISSTCLIDFTVCFDVLQRSVAKLQQLRTWSSWVGISSTFLLNVKMLWHLNMLPSIKISFLYLMRGFTICVSTVCIYPIRCDAMINAVRLWLYCAFWPQVSYISNLLHPKWSLSYTEARTLGAVPALQWNQGPKPFCSKIFLLLKIALITLIRSLNVWGFLHLSFSFTPSLLRSNWINEKWRISKDSWKIKEHLKPIHHPSILYLFTCG